MPSHQNPLNKFEQLRLQAENLIQQKPTEISGSTPDILDLIHELNIHQTELEIQNEELQRAHNEISSLEKEYEDLYDFAPCGYLTLNKKGLITRTNLTAVNLFDKSRSLLLNTGVSQYVVRDWGSAYIDARKKTIETRQKETFELPLKRKDGNPIWVRGEIDAELDETDAVVQWRIVLLDITEKRKALEALELSELKYRKMMEAITDEVYVCSPEQTIEYMNPKMIQRLGRDATGDRCFKRIHGIDKPCEWCPFDKVRDGHIIENTILSPLDNRTYRVTHMPILNEDKTVSKLTIFRDITDYLIAVEEKKISQDKLNQIQRMESIGQLAGGIAHDLNNILSPIMGFTQLSQMKLPINHPVQEDLENILAGTERAANIVKHILSFSRQKKQKLIPIDIQPVINEAVKFLRSVIPSNINVVTGFKVGGDAVVLCDEFEIHEIILNLGTNAYHAIAENKGEILIGLEKRNPPTELDLPSKEHLCLSVKDDGVGIPEIIKDRIFEPYLTTKEVGKGSGLGLSIVYGIVKNYQGGIRVDSSLKTGTVFEIYLPITDQPISSETHHSVSDSEKRGTEHILFVDDEDNIVKLFVRALEKFGYRVTGFNDSTEALEIFNSNPDDFDLVITDMAMPGMVGSQLAKRILDIRADIPIIICSGYSKRLDMIKANELKISARLDKPLKIESLLKITREVLDKSKLK